MERKHVLRSWQRWRHAAGGVPQHGHDRDGYEDCRQNGEEDELLGMGGHDGGDKMILLCVAAMRLPLQEERVKAGEEHHETA
jgi:hypothetical protein